MHALSLFLQILCSICLVSHSVAIQLHLQQSRSGHSSCTTGLVHQSSVLGLNLDLRLSIVAIACTVRCDIHLAYKLPLSSHHGSTKVVSTGSVASSALRIAHLTAFPWPQPRIQGSLVKRLSTFTLYASKLAPNSESSAYMQQ